MNLQGGGVAECFGFIIGNVLLPYKLFFINPESFPEGTLQQGLFLKGTEFGCQMHFT